ncbi:MAG TPA: hypothetical protein VIZ90_17240 [Rhizobiaceae bacterium]
MIGAALALAILGAAVPAGAVDVNRGSVRILTPGELQNLNARERRFDYQQQQQFNREIDNQAMRRQQQQQRIEVPVVKPRCPLPTSGVARAC